MINSLFIAGHETVLFDATNITRKRREVLKGIGYKIVFKQINTPKEICINRAKLSDREDLIPVIERMCLEYDILQNDEECYFE